MRVDNVNQSKKIGYIKFNTDAEMDLIGESLDRLIAKQQKIAQKVGNKDDQEMEKLERFKQSKERVIEMPKQHKMKLREMKDKFKDKVKIEKENNTSSKTEVEDIEDTEEFKTMAKNIANSEIDSGLREGTEITHRNMHTIVNALNQHIADMEKDDFYKKTRRNKNKYEKLQHLLLEAQQQKSQFERVTSKPKGWGKLRR